ncbi:demethylmenaquinone methyltransferase / 2-methoxy-6-polyprenyl-1,4-benzoquinol methylase [Erythrobacter litoralis]|uniref:Methyltransferase type 11 domain-containing protein n=1 Tax=Erythrobacter litoralis TaxID=39960 RepID=A0A074N0F5_9SPHN|nr:class I SAM-dependent methyltransferase [Erythrobacter litoralis]AOL24046.1 demethylmenaquinone methyltransferase / 2-methoxy-6-polyprenyl-1,4-benzoquinol methylase [Erythrobacter litoralis]KEO98480.1 hypothetical protein EH32_05040 [Erythrobacter litoralis]
MTDGAKDLRDLFAPGIEPIEARPGIWSALSRPVEGQSYDGRARLYDALIGNALYNRLAWGTSPASYEEFAHAASESGTGALLDAGCGTLVSTAGVHARSGRPTMLVDLSLDMLAAARERIGRVAGGVPDHVLFLQADLFDLPFIDGAFGAVLAQGVLHLFEDIAARARELARVTVPGGQVFASSLVADRGPGRLYLGALHRAGEVAAPRRLAELVARLEDSASRLARPIAARREGNMAFLTARPS